MIRISKLSNDYSLNVKQLQNGFKLNFIISKVRKKIFQSPFQIQELIHTSGK